MVTLEEVKSLKVQELKSELKSLGLPQTGRKDELVKRLEDALNESVEAEPVQQPSEKVSITNGRAPIEFKPSSTPAQLPAATGLEDPEHPPAEESVQAQPTAGLTNEEKAKKRAERFGIVSEKDKLEARAKRFGVESKADTNGKPGAIKNSTSTLTEAEMADALAKKKERAKRFKLPEPLSQEEAELKKKARLERFGGVQQAKSAEDSSALASKLAARAERFALAKPEPQKAGSAAGNTETTAVGKGKQQSVQERNDAAVAKAAALVKPAVSAEAEAKRQARAIRFQTS